MNTPQQLMVELAAVPLSGPLRVLNLSADHERVINVSGLRRVMPENISLLAGPGCAATICPQGDIYQAISLAVRDRVSVLTVDTMLDLPLVTPVEGIRSLREALQAGADVRSISAPIEAVMAAVDEPQRQFVLFVAGFESLLAPLAGLIIEGFPDNLSILLCGRRVDPLLLAQLQQGDVHYDALLLPGNRCAVTGLRAWERLSDEFRLPAAVAGYTLSNILTALHKIATQRAQGNVRIDNCYQTLVRDDGNPMSQDQLQRVFEIADGGWRGVGAVGHSAFRMRRAYALYDADRRFSDYRGELGSDVLLDLPAGCDCAAVLLGRSEPSDCRLFELSCTIEHPYGPCMASAEGACRLRTAYSVG